MVVQGVAARDLARHFIQRWNFTKVLTPPQGPGGREGPGSAYHLLLTLLFFMADHQGQIQDTSVPLPAA